MLLRRRAMAGLLSATACGVVARGDRRRAERARRRGFESVIVDAGPDRVHARVHPGPAFAARTRPLVLIHGFGGTALFQWEHQLELLAEFRPVVVPDLLWFGESASSDDDPSLHHHVRALDALLDHLGAEALDLVGVSYGGFVALEVARAQPERVKSIVMVDSPGTAWSVPRHQEMLASFGATSAADLFVPETVEDIAVLLDLAVSDPPAVPAFAAREAIETYYDPNRTALRRLLDHLEDNMEALLGEPMPAPPRALVVWGEDDPVFGVDVAPELATSLSAQLVVLQGARHLSNVDAPVEFNRALLDFLVL